MLAFDLLIGYAVTAFVLTVVGTGVTLRVLKHYHIMDNPNERSSHTVPQFRGGGWGVMVPFLLLLAVAAWLSGQWQQCAWVAGGIVLLMTVSWLDDTRGASAKLRLLAQVGAVVLGYQALPDGLILQGLLPGWAEAVLVGIGWVWFCNLYNFMDGIDGITGTQTAFIGAGVVIVTVVAGLPDMLSPLLAAALLGGGLGFLVWNWHPSKLFMGDIGSVPLGFVLGFLLLTLAAQGQLVAALIIPLYYLGDATFTILKRTAQRKKIWEAHREHFYQQAIPSPGRDHNIVMRYIIVCNVALLGCAYVALDKGWLALVPALIAVTALFLALRRRGFLVRQGLRPS